MWNAFKRGFCDEEMWEGIGWGVAVFIPTCFGIGIIAGAIVLVAKFLQ